MSGLSISSLLPLWAWAGLLLLPPLVVLLYFLKLRRRPVQVPSTFLWKKSIEDLHVNSLLQRLKRNLLLLLQLLLLLLVLLALLGLSWQGEKLLGQRFVIALDTSASMQATDAEDAATRLAAAKQKAIDLIDALPDGAEAMVVAFASDANLIQNWTTDRDELRRRIPDLEATARVTDLETAWQQLAAAAAVRRDTSEPSPNAEGGTARVPVKVFLLTDGQFREPNTVLPQEVSVDLVPVGKPETQNLGISQFTVDRNAEKPDQQQAFVEIRDYRPGPVAGSAEPISVILELWFGDQRLDAKQVQLRPGEPSREIFTLLGELNGVLEARLISDDAFPLDNTAWLALRPPRPGRFLLVTPGNEPLETVLTTQASRELATPIVQRPAYLETDEYDLQARSGFFDLVIFDRCSPETMPQANTMFLGSLPPGDEWKSEGDVESPQIVAIDRTNPLMGLVQLGDVLIVSARDKLKPPPGGQTLVDSPQGALIAVAPRGGFRDLVLGFPLKFPDAQDKNGTDWPIRLSFATFMFNVLEQLAQREDAAAGQMSRPGESVTFRNPAGGEVATVTAPSGEQHTVPRQGSGDYTFTATEELGPYTLRWDDQTSEAFAVNLFSPDESLVFQQTPQLTSSSSSGEVSVPTLTRYGLWKYLLIAACGVLLVEWVIYTRRVSL